MNFSHIKAIVWDFDGVWYDYNALPDNGFYDLCDHSAAEAGCRLVPSLSYEDSLNAARTSYRLYNDGISAHIPFLMDTGLSEQEARISMFRTYHSSLFLKVQEQHSHILTSCHNTIASLEIL